MQTIDKGNLTLGYNPETGQLLSVHDRSLDLDVIRFEGGAELEINEHALPLKMVNQDEPGVSGPAWQCNLRSVTHPSIGCAQGLDIMRLVVVGSECRPWGGHLDPPNSLHIRYRINRARVDSYHSPEAHSAGQQQPVQMPLWLDTVGLLCARTDWFGPETKMLQASIGGCGPRSHVGLEDGPVNEVVPHLWNTFRRTHPGAQMIPGAAYYHEDGRWLWITAQRPTVGMHWDYETERQVARFEYHALLNPAEIIHTPEVSLYWGCGGREEMLKVMNQHFIRYEEPPDWFYHTTWFWFNWWRHRANGFADIAEQAQFLHDELGLTGFGITTHDLRPGMWDCGTSRLAPSPHLGGEEGLRKLGETIRGFGGHMFVWLPWNGMSQPSPELKPDWCIQGQDGRPYTSFSLGSCDLYQGLNFNHPEVQEYYLDWIRRYICEFGVDGIFWDCGGGPQPPDFAPADKRPFQRFPSESMTGGYKFMEKVIREGRKCSPDFFMWHECFSQDLPATGYSTHTGNDAFAMELNRHGPNRLVYRSGSTYNLYGGLARVAPAEDSSLQPPGTLDAYRDMTGDAMNKWIVQFVREHGIRQAQGIQPGVACCDAHVIVDPAKEPRQVTIPEWAAKPKTMIDVMTGRTFKPDSVSPDGVTFTLPGRAAYQIVPASPQQ